MKPVRLGFIGLGHITTRSHLPGLAPLVEAGAVILQAFCDINEETVKTQAATFGAQATYTDHHEMCDKEDLDAIYPLYSTDTSHGRNPNSCGQRLCYLCRKTTNAGHSTSSSVQRCYPKRGYCVASRFYESLLSLSGRDMPEIAGTHVATCFGATTLQR